MPIPFTQFMPPFGEKKPTSITRPPDIEAAAMKLIDAGCRFEAEVLRTGEVSFEVVGPEDDHGDPRSLAMEVVSNGPDVLSAVDRLVIDATAAVAAGELT